MSRSWYVIQCNKVVGLYMDKKFAFKYAEELANKQHGACVAEFIKYYPKKKQVIYE